MRLVGGAILVLLGLLFLLDNLNLYNFNFGDFIADFWPVALILAGAAIIYRQMRSPDREVWEDFVGKQHSKSLGDLKLKPKSLPTEGSRIKHGMGDLTFDLTDCILNAGENVVECSLGAGDLRITVPQSVPVKVSCTVGGGEIYLLGAHADGIGQTLVHEDDGYATAPIKLSVRAKVGLGQCHVVHG